MNTKLDFINGNTKKCLLAMTLPMIVAMFLNMAYNLVDSLWIGNLLGELAYAALTNSTPIVLLLTSVAMGATNGISILLSQAIGARNEQKKKKVISTSFCIAVIFSLFITFILELFLPVILAALNTPAETMNMARDYLSIYILGYICIKYRNKLLFRLLEWNGKTYKEYDFDDFLLFSCSHTFSLCFFIYRTWFKWYMDCSFD